MQDTSTQRETHESDGCPRGASSGSLECHGAFHKTGSVEARDSNCGDIRLGPTRDLAVGGARRSVRPSPEHSPIFEEAHHNADPGVVACRIDVKGERRKGRNPGCERRSVFP
ncbi:rab1 small GTP-binding protein [Trypanosoma cruzi]|nr:rab1 small GTP-binding protein [Trypanosoma cruzi]